MSDTYKVTWESFTIVGISTRTNNKIEMSDSPLIPKLWERFYREDIVGQIGNAAEAGVVYAAYSDYAAKDSQADYTLTIGVKLINDKLLAGPWKRVEVPSGPYTRFTSSVGTVPHIIIDTWKTIWGISSETRNQNRAFSVDFEVYDERVNDPKHSQVDIYVSIKK